MGLKGSGGLLTDWAGEGIPWDTMPSPRSFCCGGAKVESPGGDLYVSAAGLRKLKQWLRNRPSPAKLILEFERGEGSAGVSKGLKLMALGVEKPRSLQRVLRLYPAAAFSLTQAFDALHGTRLRVGRNIARNPAGPAKTQKEKWNQQQTFALYRGGDTSLCVPWRCVHVASRLQ